ncbi:MAG TPA: hypothetical protein VHK69_02570, partial [Chitinophagaceae bacterium]|nr:hypothetical protein [Chitinophagaceae bacterium]
IKDLKEEDREYKIFALDGLTKGCQVEYHYTVKKYPAFFGREIIASNFPVMKSRFDLITPGHLHFETKSFNNLPACKDTLIGEKRALYVEAEGLDASEEEKYSMFDASLKRVEYKLSFNKASADKTRLFTWNELARKAYALYTDVSEKERKRIRDLVKEAGVKEGQSEAEKIMAIENFFKKHYIAREELDDEDAADLLKVIKSKVSSERAYCKLIGAALTEAGVPFQIVLAGDRSDYTIDRNLENWSNARHFLFYFPGTRKYMAPTATVFRYPWIPPNWTNTNGLFCVATSIGGMNTAIAEIRSIPMEEYKHSFLNMDIKAKLDDEGESLELDVAQSYGGYAAGNYRVPFVYYDAEDQRKFMKELIKFGTNSENILSQSLENKEMEQSDPYVPFIIKAKVKSAQLVERAGNKIIVKVGEFIGQQSEMYETKERKTDIDVTYPHALVRTIELTLPQGYEVKNLKDLQFNEVYKEKEQLTMGFVCTYEQTGNVLRITIREDYARYHYPLEQYPAFKKVINAAADFNKVVLVLEKK